MEVNHNNKKSICYIVTIPETIRAFFIPQLQYLANKDFEVTVICSPDSNLQKELGNSIKYIPVEIPRGKSFVGMISAIRKLIQLFRQQKFDMVQYSTPNAALAASVAAFYSKVSIRNYHVMGFRFMTESGLKRFFLKSFEKITCFLSTSIETVSYSNLELNQREHIFPTQKGCVVWNGSTGGVDLTKFCKNKRDEFRTSLRKYYNIPNNEFVFGFVGRITKDKGIDELLEAFMDLNKGYLLIIGSREGIQTLNPELYQKSLKRQNIIYVDKTNLIEKYFAAIDILVLPSHREGFGNVIIEAAALGTPSIVTDIPGPVDATIENETALRIPVGDSRALAEAMNTFVEMDINEYKKFQDRSIRFVENKYDSKKLNREIYKRKKQLLKL